MTVISLNSIVNNILLKRRYSIHWYLDFLIPAKDALREISMDENINTLRYQILPLDSNNIATLPNDYVDYAKVSARAGQYLQPLVEDNSLNTLPNFDSTFVEQPYSNGVLPESSDTSEYIPGGYLSPYWWMVNTNNYGENTGRQFGGIGAMADTFKIDKRRNIIKVNEALALTEIVLEYVGNGIDADSATHIDSYAQMAIESFAMWQFKANNRTYSESEVRNAEATYINERLKLRARLSDLTIEKLKRIVQGNTRGMKY